MQLTLHHVYVLDLTTLTRSMSAMLTRLVTIGSHVGKVTENSFHNIQTQVTMRAQMNEPKQYKR